MRLLITGGTGFIGSRLAILGRAKGHEVVVFGQENNPAEAENRHLVEGRGAQFILGCVTDRERVSEALEGVDWVYHLAACQHEANVPDQRFWDVNVEGTRNLLEASVRASVKRFIHGSTIGVYGSLEGRIDEKSPLQPDNIYGVTKLEGEKLVLSYRETLPVVVIRISETYGPGDRRLLKLFKGIQKGIFLLVGNGENKHHLIYIEDLLEGLLLAAAAKEAIGRIFVLPGKTVLTTREMATAISNELKTKTPELRLPLFPLLALATVLEMTLRPLGIQPPLHRRRMGFFTKSFVLSGKEAENILGFTPKVGFDEGVAETAKWYRQMGYL